MFKHICTLILLGVGISVQAMYKELLINPADITKVTRSYTEYAESYFGPFGDYTVACTYFHAGPQAGQYYCTLTAGTICTDDEETDDTLSCEYSCEPIADTEEMRLNDDTYHILKAWYDSH